MIRQSAQLPELFATIRTVKRFLPRVNLHMIGQRRSLPELLRADCAFVGLISCVDLHVVG